LNIKIQIQIEWFDLLTEGLLQLYRIRGGGLLMQHLTFQSTPFNCEESLSTKNYFTEGDFLALFFFCNEKYDPFLVESNAGKVEP